MAERLQRSTLVLEVGGSNPERVTLFSYTEKVETPEQPRLTTTPE